MILQVAKRIANIRFAWEQKEKDRNGWFDPFTVV